MIIPVVALRSNSRESITLPAKRYGRPLVSVVMPFRNAAETLAEALDSIQSQTMEEFELLAIDDGSQDRSTEILQSRLGSDSRLRIFFPGRVGLVKALNLGIKESRADLVARMDADDVMHPRRLELQYRFLEKRPELALAASRVEMFPPENVKGGYLEYLRWQNGLTKPREIGANIYWESPFVHPSVMFRKNLVLKLGGYREGPFPEDYELWLRIFQAGFSMAKLPKVLLRWREHPGRLSRVDPRCSREAFDRIRALYLGKDSRLLAGRELVIWGAGRSSRKRARLLMEQGVRASAWIDVDPRKIGKQIWDLKVYPPCWLQHRRPRPLVLVYVRSRGAKEQIREYLSGIGYREGPDFFPVG